MKQPPLTLKISEIFPSIQGEGLNLGSPAIFVRFSGCNLKCHFCDTQYAWNKGEEKTLDKIIKNIQDIQSAFPAKWVCLTGGEPLIQGIKPLTERLKKLHFFLQLETNATLYQPLPLDWITISPKPDEYLFRPEYQTQAKEIKIVVTKDLEFSVIRNMRKAFPEHIPIWLQPQSSRKWSQKKAKELLIRSIRGGLSNIRLGIQMHKIFGLR